jgi:hypothetical protein
MLKNLAMFFALPFLLLSFMSNLTVWENVAVCLFIFSFFDFLDNLGKKIVVMDLTTIMACLTCLFMPVIFYHVYTRDNPLARLWVKYMPISSDDYFSFAVPAVIAMVIGFKIPLGKLRYDRDPEKYVQNAKRYLQDKPKIGLILVAIGFTSGMLSFLAPGNLRQVFYFMAHLTHVGVFYAIYSPNKHKRQVVIAVLLLVLGQSILAGMFGELIFVLACSLIIILLGKKVQFRKKFMFAVGGIFLIILLQSIKKDYRRHSWLQESGADPAYFAELISDRISDPSQMFNPSMMFYTAVRMNQGWLVAMTMRFVPNKYSFAYGETIWQSVAAAIVPRFVWPDKPETGGKANLKRFWGFNLVGFSTNIGILGEAYANFDRTGGVIYMFCYGLFFNLILSLFLKRSAKTPALVLWIPFLFFTSIAIETDLLSTLGALLKGLFFTWMIFFLFRILFRIQL